ncbi:MAG: radical SAM family heme chaperone HemW [Caldilineaceae bacterium]|nr:radical SAM family heme chaperone HemW [Caldilineaceae bacterium]HRJ44152.1 radical SAM family heme chaperone HemW [Caldilineaceae bacterium]
MERIHSGDAQGTKESDEPLGLYVHIPFCEKKCPYCDFNTYAKLDSIFQSYVDALCLELEMWAARIDGRTIHTIFVGGGTPTVLALSQLAQIFETIHRCYRLAETCEITSEANPGTVDQAKFAGLVGLGVNRLSMGVQSFDPDELNFLGRIHSVDDVGRAYDGARSAGFANINLDFIFGLPNQSTRIWAATLEKAIALAPEHLSLYSLIVEPETPLFHWVETGRVPGPDDDLAGELYETAITRLAEAGYSQYEVSNWVKKGSGTGEWELGRSSSDPRSPIPSPCFHNLLYWRNQEYIGVGPGSHSHMRLPFAHPTATPSADAVGLRWSNRKPVPGYIKRMQTGETVVDFWEEIDSRTAMGETMMLGLRLVEEGVSRARFRQRHGVEMDAVFADELARLGSQGMLISDGETVRLTERGLMLGNQVFAAFLL